MEVTALGHSSSDVVNVMKSCENCWREIGEDYEFCPYCGHRQDSLRFLDGEPDDETT